MRSFLAVVLALVSLALHAAPPKPPSVIGKAWMVGDLSSGQLLAAQKADERVEPASLTKIMTACGVFRALRDKKLAPAQRVRVSERAWRAPGPRMCIEPPRPGTVEELSRRRAGP